jgi:hypothetical protein
MADTIFFGERNCVAITGRKQNCTNRAYFRANGEILCGVHSKKYKDRIELPKNPNQAKLLLDAAETRQKLILEAKSANIRQGHRGAIIVSKMRMMKPIPHVNGHLSVFPNWKHDNRKDGYGCAALSPKSLGPIAHHMPNLPIAVCLENFHQFAKIWPFELKNGEVTAESKQYRIENYKSKVPCRHKYNYSELKKYAGVNINIPLFSVFYTDEGHERRFSYLQSRYFYCHFYEVLAKKEPAFAHLVDLVKGGTNINIIGYDGYNIGNTPEAIYAAYIDTSRPFGHEVVLYCLLVIGCAGEYPWNIYRVKDAQAYEGITF